MMSKRQSRFMHVGEIVYDRFATILFVEKRNDKIKFDFSAKADFLKSCDSPAENTIEDHVSQPKYRAEQEDQI